MSSSSSSIGSAFAAAVHSAMAGQLTIARQVAGPVDTAASAGNSRFYPVVRNVVLDSE
jgi:hypothetical protein